ncbi:MAG: aminoglycoside phosphotransferase family protein [Pirellulaceae bacterium]
MSQQAELDHVLRQYSGIVLRGIEHLGGAGGFSGAAFWRIATDDDDRLCLRRWPAEHPNRRQLQAIHDALRHVAEGGFAKLPVPFLSRDGQTIVAEAGHLWELAPWLPGKADFHEHPTAERLDAAMVALAQFHRGIQPLGAQTGNPPGITSRREQLDRLCAGGTNEMSRAVSVSAWPEFRQCAAAILDGFNEHAPGLKPLLDSARRLRLPLHPCIRDIWHDHVLFEGNEVTGFVDFGAMRIEHVACDISRLLGSLVANDRSKWEQGLAAYQTLKSLSDDELMLVDAYDRSNVLLSGMNWVQWIAVEDRQFEDRQRVLLRLDEIIARLATLTK